MLCRSNVRLDTVTESTDRERERTGARDRSRRFVLSLLALLVPKYKF